jgi:hypothetical protein
VTASNGSVATVTGSRVWWSYTNLLRIGGANRAVTSTERRTGEEYRAREFSSSRTGRHVACACDVHVHHPAGQSSGQWLWRGMPPVFATRW